MRRILSVCLGGAQRRQQQQSVSILQRQWSKNAQQRKQTKNQLFQRAFFHSSPSSSASSNVGLYSIPELQQPSDFFKLTKQAIIDSDELRNSLNDSIETSNDAIDTLYQLDEISRKVCNVIDAAELCRSTHASNEWRLAAAQAFDQLQGYIANLNSDERLYNSLKGISERSDFTTLQAEQQRFCTLLKREFELDGIHLPLEQRQYVQELHHRVNQLETLFAQNITNSMKPFTINATDIESVLSRQVLEMNGAKYIQSSSSEEGDGQQQQQQVVQIYADTPITHSLLSYANKFIIKLCE